MIARRADGLLADSERGRLDAHLAACADCRAEWVAQEGLGEMLRRELSVPEPRLATARARIEAAILAAPAPVRRAGPHWIVPALAAAALVAVVGWFVVPRGDGDGNGGLLPAPAASPLRPVLVWETESFAREPAPASVDGGPQERWIRLRTQEWRDRGARSDVILEREDREDRVVPVAHWY
ncbi:MAG: zf-HC2 domain-containing protein [Planctomycetes bacterium]|nr:zf-HC2 domain-containing protein [Planctomycetota bacterium]